MKRAVVMADRRLIDAADLELAPSDEQLPDLDLRAARLRAEREVIQVALARSNNTLSVAARLLGISRPTLYSLMEAHGIEIELGKGRSSGSSGRGELTGRHWTSRDHGTTSSTGVHGIHGQARAPTTTTSWLAIEVEGHAVPVSWLAPAGRLDRRLAAGRARCRLPLQCARALKKGDLRSAQIDLRNAVRADPQNAEAHYWLGQVSFELGDPVAAEREAEAATARGFDPHLTTRLLGQALLAQNKFDDLLTQAAARRQGRQPRRHHPGVPRLRGNRPEAAGRWRRRRSTTPSRRRRTRSSRCWPKRGCWRHAATWTAARRKIDHAISAQPKSAEALLAKSQLLRMKGDMTGALAVLDDLIKDQPSIVQARLDRASLEIALSKTDAARAGYRGGAEGDAGQCAGDLPASGAWPRRRRTTRTPTPTWTGSPAYLPRIPRAYLLLAVVKEQLGQLEQAEDAAQRYLARAPNDLAAYKVLSPHRIRQAPPGPR